MEQEGPKETGGPREPGGYKADKWGSEGGRRVQGRQKGPLEAGGSKGGRRVQWRQEGPR
jgi:hypothetical protein